jgi:hypothetical protein
MKRALPVLFLLLTAATARADEPKSVNFEACRFWIYASEVRGYVCSFPGGSMTAYTTSEVDQIVGQLQQQIQALDARVKKLEGHPD